MKVLITGAAGYIGSIVTERLMNYGHQVIASDNLQSGHRESVHPQAIFEQGDLRDAEWLKHLFERYPVDAVFHLAAESLIDLSLRDPGRFFRSNVSVGINVLDALVAAGVKRLIISSTAAVYGEPTHMPITEDTPLNPVNAYGESKLALERMLGWYRRAHGMNYISLRYFNACGASQRYGEFHVPETHIIPVLFEVAMHQREAFQLFGTDFATFDGTCIRDYVHVSDIADAHVMALENLDRIGARIYNLGNGKGYSNAQVIEIVQAVTGHKIKVIPLPRRPGDPAVLIAGSERIQKELGWQPRYTELRGIVETAWTWRKTHPRGYRSNHISSPQANSSTSPLE